MSFRNFICLQSCLVRRIVIKQYPRNFSRTCIRIERNKHFKLMFKGNFSNMETRSMQRRKIAQQAVSNSALIVEHDEKRKEFYVKLPCAQETNVAPKAVLQYDWVSDKYVDLYHTGVPEEFRGKGVAKLLAEAALDHFVEDDVTMKLSCTYLQYHVDKFPVPRIMDKIDKSW